MPGNADALVRIEREARRSPFSEMKRLKVLRTLGGRGARAPISMKLPALRAATAESS